MNATFHPIPATAQPHTFSAAFAEAIARRKAVLFPDLHGRAACRSVRTCASIYAKRRTLKAHVRATPNGALVWFEGCAQ